MAAFKLIFDLLAEQRLNLPLVPTASTCAGKTYIITGSNTGIGLEAARHLALLGAANVILAVRNLLAGDEAKTDIESTMQRNGLKTAGVVEVWKLDIASYASVKAFAKKAESLDGIDGLIENAGVALDVWHDAEGHESTIMINVLGTVMLAVLMLPKMSADAKRLRTTPHIAIVTSEVGFLLAKPEFDKVKDDPMRKADDKATADMNARYPLSKIFLSLSIRELASLIPASKSGVVINLINPGLCKTKLITKGRLVTRVQAGLMNLLMGRTPEMGSRTLLHGLFAGKESHGCYLSCCEIREKNVPTWVTDEEGQAAQKRVWGDVAKELESAEPGCLTKVGV